MPAKKTTAVANRSASRTKQSAAPKKRAAATPRSSRKATTAGDESVTIDRRRNDRRSNEQAVSLAPVPERRAKVQRRRQIDPTTCERDYSPEEIEFMNAMDEYKRKNGRMFPTCSEVLEVLRSLGYVRLSPAGQVILAAEGELDAVHVRMETVDS